MINVHAIKSYFIACLEHELGGVEAAVKTAGVRHMAYQVCMSSGYTNFETAEVALHATHAAIVVRHLANTTIEPRP